jgi:transcriptional regulator with XRE-family HTH domain
MALVRRPKGAPPDAALYYDPDPVYLRSLVERIGLSQNATARKIGVSERAMRYYLSEIDRSSPAPYPVQVALEELAR